MTPEAKRTDAAPQRLTREEAVAVVVAERLRGNETPLKEWRACVICGWPTSQRTACMYGDSYRDRLGGNPSGRNCWATMFEADRKVIDHHNGGAPLLFPEEDVS